MSLKLHGKEWVVREQIVEDPTSGLTFQFELNAEGQPQLRVFGEAIPFGNREILFDYGGGEIAAEACIGGCRPEWRTPEDE